MIQARRVPGTIAGEAQLDVRSICNRRGAGSNPVAGSICGGRITANTPAFQAGNGGSIPLPRSMVNLDAKENLLRQGSERLSRKHQDRAQQVEELAVLAQTKHRDGPAI